VAERSRNLSQTELAAVLKRAAELDAEGGGLPVPLGGLDPDVVEAAAVEAGLSPQAVRRALDEVLHPDEQAPDVYAAGRLPTREMVVEREVPGSVDEVEARIGRFLRRQLFVQQRVFADGSRWGPKRGVVANIQKGIDPGGRLALKQVRAVSITLSTLDPAPEADRGSVLVRVGLDLSGVRSIHATWLGVGGAAGALAMVGTAGAVGVDPLALLSVPVAGGLTFGGHVVGRREARSEVDKIHTAVAGLLDQLEHGERAESSRGKRARRSSTRPSSSRRATLSTDTDTDTDTDSSSGPAAGQEDDRA
jgi:hypothetical protein